MNPLIFYQFKNFTNFFSPLDKKKSFNKKPIILFSGRIIKEKGIIELCEIALNQFASAEKKISIERCNINIDPNELWEVWCNLRSKITFDDLSSLRIQNFEELGFPVKWEYEQGEKIKEADISNAIDHYLKDRSYL